VTLTQEQTTALAAFILVAARAAVAEQAHPFSASREWLDERTKAHAAFIKAFSADTEGKAT
jgi:hypothetical protein